MLQGEILYADERADDVSMAVFWGVILFMQKISHQIKCFPYSAIYEIATNRDKCGTN